MNKTLNTILSGVKFVGIFAVAGAALMSGGKALDAGVKYIQSKTPAPIVYQQESYLPKVESNQQLIVDPLMMRGSVPVEYMLLTDVDRDGKWDTGKYVHMGYTTGDACEKVFFKEGYSPLPPLFPPYHPREVLQVDAAFFEPYQNLASLVNRSASKL